MAAARALDLPGGGAVGTAGRGDRAYLDRRRGRAVALGAAALALFADLGAGVPVAPADPPFLGAAVAAVGDRRRGAAARGRRRTEFIADAPRASALLLRHRD